MKKSRFFYGYHSKAEVNNMCKSGMGSPKNSPVGSPAAKRSTLNKRTDNSVAEDTRSAEKAKHYEDTKH